MNTTQKKSDLISSLPTDSSLPSTEDLTLVRKVLKKEINLFAQIKESLFVVLILFFISLPQVDSIFQKIPSLQSEYLRLLVKAVIGGLIFLALKIFYI